MQANFLFDVSLVVGTARDSLWEADADSVGRDFHSLGARGRVEFAKGERGNEVTLAIPRGFDLVAYSSEDLAVKELAANVGHVDVW